MIVSAADRGGGVAAVTLSLDGGPARTLASGCAAPYSSLQPCPALADRAFALDAPDGDHTASGAVVDAAGNVTAWGPLAVAIHRTTISAATQPATVAPAGESERLTLSRATLKHPPGGKARLAGTLKTAAGAPVAGARLTVSWFDLGADGAVRARSPPSPRERTAPSRSRSSATARSA